MQNKLPVGARQEPGRQVRRADDREHDRGGGRRRPRACRPTSAVSLTNAPGADAYPIASFTWLLVYKDQPNEAKGKRPREVPLVGDPRRASSTRPRSCTRRCRPGREEIEAKIKQITFSGKPLLAAPIALGRRLDLGGREDAADGAVPAPASGQPGRSGTSAIASSRLIAGLGVAGPRCWPAASSRRSCWESWAAIRAFGFRFLVTSTLGPGRRRVRRAARSSTARSSPRCWRC